MKGFTLAAAAAALFASASAAIDPIVIKGNKFFYKTNGTQFYMRGVAYQQGVNSNSSQTENLDYTDPLADKSSCMRDIPFLQKLRTNTIRVYAIDPTKNHDDCMNALADAGIYVVADLSQPGESINRNDAEWTVPLYQRYTNVVDVMAKYDNTLGFFAGNEVSNAPNNTQASEFVKAAVRDTKAYIKSKNYRPIGVGYATNDDASIRVNLANYFDCGDASDAIDFWGYNIYSWCGSESSFQISGYDVRTKEFAKYNVPVFFAEYGCNTPRPRVFDEVAALYGSQMTDVWSGGIVYMYFEEENKFGLVSVSGNSVKTLDDFNNLSSKIAKVNPTGVKMSDFTPTNTKPADCPAINTDWAAVATPLPPVVNADLCNCMSSTLSCTIKDSVDEKDYGDIFGFICGLKKGAYCAGINRNSTKGAFGAFGMCESKLQLSFAMNQYYLNNTNGGCDFSSRGQVKQASKTATGSCGTLLAQAGPQGTGTVTSAPSGGANPSSTGSKGAASGLTVPSFQTGIFSLGLYVAGAALSGMAMVLL